MTMARAKKKRAFMVKNPKGELIAWSCCESEKDCREIVVQDLTLEPHNYSTWEEYENVGFSIVPVMIHEMDAGTKLMSTDEEMKVQYPSVDLAYPLAVDSYNEARERLDSVNSRLQNLITLTLTLTFGVPVVIEALGVSFGWRWMVVVMISFLVALILGTYGSLCGSFKLIDPGLLYDRYLGYSEWDFKKNFIYWAGYNSKANRELIEKKWRISIGITALLFIEILGVVLWVFFQI